MKKEEFAASLDYSPRREVATQGPHSSHRPGSLRSPADQSRELVSFDAEDKNDEESAAYTATEGGFEGNNLGVLLMNRNDAAEESVVQDQRDQPVVEPTYAGVTTPDAPEEKKWHERPSFKVFLVGCSLLALLQVVGIVMLAVLIASPRSAGETSPAILPPSMPTLPPTPTTSPPSTITLPPSMTTLTSPPSTRTPTAISTSFSTPETIACEFIGRPSLTECRSTLRFDSFSTGEMVTGSSIPSEIGLLTQLTALLVDGNGLMGSIPSEISLLTDLVVLSFTGNALTGRIPSSISRLAQLTNLWLDQNTLTGPLPLSISNMTSLVLFDMSSNALTGPIPPSVSRLTRLTALDFFENAFTGTIPPSFSLLTNLEFLEFHGNSLVGSIPSSLSTLTLLTTLSFSFNDLTGTVPASLCLQFISIFIDCGEIECICCSDRVSETPCA